jgi:transposase InsO family protein
MDTALAEIYYDPAKVGSFGGVKSLSRGANDKNAKDWLIGQETYTLHKPVKRKFRRRKTISIGIDHLWQIDLADVSSLSNHNDGHRFLLTCIDCFSRYAWAVPLKNKNSTSVMNAFRSIIVDNRQPTYLQSDKGTEFLNSTFQTFLKSNNIRFYTSENDDIKCALVERFNRTLKTRMWRYFTRSNSFRYIDVLADLVKSYNDTIHSSIKTAPSLVTVHNEAELRRVQYKPQIPSKPKFAVDDTVRISETKLKFKKGYLSGWSRELFKVAAVIPTDPYTYSIVDTAGDPVHGKFYAEELQRVVQRDEVFKVEKILKTRKRLGKTEYFVRWLGYPSKFDSWVDSVNV